jgi:hypothetical protein
MALNTNPIFISAGNFTPARIAAANTASDGSGSLVTLVTAVTDGTRVDAVRFRNAQATNAASSAMVHRIFLSNTSGSSYRLVGEVATAAATRSASAIGATSVTTFDQPIIMKSGQILAVVQSVYAGAQDQVDATAYAGDYTA